MTKKLQQGDILKVEGIKSPVLVASKDFFNQSGEIIACPILKNSTEGPLHISVDAYGYVQCEKLALLDMNVRGYSKMGSLPLASVIDITDAIQGIFDYI